ncbi:XkdF-like putative serine protease domain-containing protein [Bacillus sp. NPDC077411]|uniref:XkdF-like putative serine protease domain-containing protein n=1 Tax=Bacillus sp. NPDC077411 TaxID=3363947 RepID=UPI0037CC5E9B
MTVRELKNAEITHVSYVDKAANKRKFFLTKAAEKPTFQKEVKLLVKSDDPQKLVYGVVYEPGVADAHNDFMTAEEIEKAAHKFIADARNIDTQHDFEAGAGEVVESYIAPADFEVNGQTVQKGSWVIVTKATDEIWEQIQKGEITGYSMAGLAEVEEKEEISKTEDGMFKSFMKHMGAFFNGASIMKGEVRDNYAKNQQYRNVWAAWDSLENAYYGSKWDNYTSEAVDFDRLLVAIQDFSEIIQEIREGGDVAIAKALEIKPNISLAAEIEKAGKKISGVNMEDIEAAFTALQNIKDRVSDEEETELKLEDITKTVEEAVKAATAPINERLEKLEKGEDPGTGGEEGNEIVKQVEEVVKSALGQLSERLDKVESARGISKQEEKHEEPQPVQKSVWEGLL